MHPSSFYATLYLHHNAEVHILPPTPPDLMSTYAVTSEFGWFCCLDVMTLGPGNSYLSLPLCRRQVLTPRMLFLAPSRSWTPREQEASRRSCEHLFLALHDFNNKQAHPRQSRFRFGDSQLSTPFSLEELLTTQCDRFSKDEVKS